MITMWQLKLLLLTKARRDDDVVVVMAGDDRTYAASSFVFGSWTIRQRQRQRGERRTVFINYEM